jgi:hypothetical protein
MRSTATRHAAFFHPDFPVCPFCLVPQVTLNAPIAPSNRQLLEITEKFMVIWFSYKYPLVD